MCVLGGEIGKDSCKGDSGGGLYIQVKILNVSSCIMVVLYGPKIPSQSINWNKSLRGSSTRLGISLEL